MKGKMAIYNSMAAGVPLSLPPRPRFFRPTATMLTDLETAPAATATDIPPLENHSPFAAAIRHGHGRFLFSSENEVMYFDDDILCNG